MPAGMDRSERGPDFLCIGMEKAGTAWIYRMLRGHPECWMPPLKELNFFAGRPRVERLERIAERYASRAASGQRIDEADRLFIDTMRRFGRNGPERFSDYARLFAPAGRRVAGDVSPIYAKLGAQDVRNVRHRLPHAKLVLSVRHPVDRAWSALSMRQRNGVWPEADLSDPAAVRDLVCRPEIWRHCLATKVYETWSSIFPADRILVLLFDDLVSEPQRVRDRLSEFLAIDPGMFQVAAGADMKRRRNPNPMPEAVEDTLNGLLHAEAARCAEMFQGAAADWPMLERAEWTRDGGAWPRARC